MPVNKCEDRLYISGTKKRTKKLRPFDTMLKILVWGSSFATVAILAWILAYIVANGIGHISWEFVSTPYGRDQTGILPMMVSTLAIIVCTLLISTPIGIFSAVYLVEYSKPGKLVNVIRFTTETLAGIPSIIYGLFGLIFFVTFLGFRWSLLSGSLTLSIMVLPVIIRTTEEALKAVPLAYKEGSLALGATRLKTIMRIILPCAIPGILAAVILSVGRIIGETAAVYLTAGMVPRIPTSIMESGRTLSVHLYMLAKEGLSFEQAFATATILVILVASINFIASRIASNISKLSTGK